MATATSVTVNDRAATPLAHVFVPRDLKSDPMLWVETGTVPFGERKLKINNVKNTGSKIKVRIVFEVPVLATEIVNGVNKPVVLRTSFAELLLTYDKLSSLQERKDTVAFIYNALATSQTMVDSTVTGLEGIW
jgi:hypothetical protein